MSKASSPRRAPFGVAHISQEAMYRAMVEQSLDGLMVLEGERFIDCNPAAERMYGVAREQFMLIPPIAFSPECQADGRNSLEVAREYLELANRGVPQRFEWLARRFDGSVFPTEVCLSGLFEGKTVRTIAVVRDLSERKRAERESLEKSTRLQILLDNFPGGVSLSDENGTLLAWNEALRDVLDLPPSLFADGAPQVGALLEYGIARGEFAEFGSTAAQKIAALKDLRARRQPYTYQRCRHDGAIIEVRSAPVSDGGFVTTCIDVTAQTQMQQAYKQQTLLLNAVLSNLPQGVSVFDDQLRLQIWNQGFLDVLDYDPASVYKGVSFEQLLQLNAKRGEYGPGDCSQQVAERLALARRFSPHRFERTRPNGHTHLVQGQPIHEDGELRGFVTTYTDITDLKTAERALAEANARLEQNVADRTSQLRLAQDDLIRSEKLAALGALVAGVAHELNTPIGNSVLIASTLKDRTAEFSKAAEQGQIKRSDLARYVQDAEEASTLLGRSLESASELIKSFKQVAVDQASSQRRQFNLANVSQDILATVRSKLRKAGVKMDLDIDCSIEMHSYPGPLEQIISNLVDNALLHAFEAHTGEARIWLLARHCAAGRIELRFCDNGSGIPPENQPRIFDPFFTTKLGKGGSGLGLHIVYNIVTSMLGGQIRVESQAGRGTCFVLQLPLTAPEERK